MRSVLTVLVFGVAMLAGAVTGAVAAFYGTGFFCILVDRVRGAGPGDGLVTIGWLFCIVTVPYGLYLGGYAAGVVVEAIRSSIASRSDPLRDDGQFRHDDAGDSEFA